MTALRQLDSFQVLLSELTMQKHETDKPTLREKTMK